MDIQFNTMFLFLQQRLKPNQASIELKKAVSQPYFKQQLNINLVKDASPSSVLPQLEQRESDASRHTFGDEVADKDAVGKHSAEPCPPWRRGAEHWQLDEAETVFVNASGVTPSF